MADPLSPDSGLLALTTVALESSITLRSTIRTLKHQPKIARDLIQELESVSQTLRSLVKTPGTSTNVHLSTLEGPLRRFGHVCKEFELEISKHLPQSDGSRTSFRDWGKLQYITGDMAGFTQLVAGYKSTFNVALADANL